MKDDAKAQFRAALVLTRRSHNILPPSPPACYNAGMADKLTIGFLGAGKMAAALAKALPLQRYGEKEEIAELAMFLASDAAKYITGAVVPCDGGSCLVGSGAWAQALAGAVR